jgi:hypothetical protein
MAYIGVQPTDTYLSIASQQITGNGGANYTLDYSVSDEESLAVFVNNVRQNVSSYTVSGTSLTLGGTISASDECWVLFLGRTVGTKTPAVGSVTNDMLAGSIATSKLANQNIGFRNLIINGDMSIAQRGTSFSFSSSSGYTVDRFDFTQTSGATGDCTITQEADAPSNTGLVKSVKIAVDTAETPTSGGNCIFQQGIEGFNCAPLEHGQSSPPSATLSFWVKSNKTGTYSVQIKAQGSTGRYVLFDYTISSANTWEKKTITWVGDTSIALNYDNSNQLRVIWHLSSGPDDKVSPTSSWVTSSSLQMSSNAVNFFDSASNEIYITGVQLEVGTTASDFEFLPYDVNLNRCYRYYYKRISTDPYGPLAQGMQIGASDMMIQGYHPITMRASPTMSISGTWNYEAGTTSGTWSIGSQRTNPTAWAAQSSFSNTNGSAAIIYANNDSTAALIGSAEL